MWIGTLIEKQDNSGKSSVDKEVQEIIGQIYVHFDGVLESQWFDELFPYRETLIKFGLLFLQEYGTCETCIPYIGTKRTARKHFNIAVLNSYCGKVCTKVKHDSRCPFWEPKEFWKRVMKSKLKKMIKTTSVKYND